MLSDKLRRIQQGLRTEDADGAWESSVSASFVKSSPASLRFELRNSSKYRLRGFATLFRDDITFYTGYDKRYCSTTRDAHWLEVEFTAHGGRGPAL